MIQILYVLIAICATTIGAMTGMGGGIIIKPILDMISFYDTTTIGLISGVIVFTMSIVSLIKQKNNKKNIKFKYACPIVIGAVLGGILGEKTLNVLLEILKMDKMIKIIQNIVLVILIFFVIFFMIYKEKIKTYNFSFFYQIFFIGLILGFFASFLGIGGGPINVPLLILAFSFDTKTSILYSILIIFFAQLSKLSLYFIEYGIPNLDWYIVFPMTLGAVLGSVIGSYYNKKLSPKKLEKAFNATMCFILIICLYTITINLF